ncbi:uncharacterized protein DNG_04699 [Cephalotrichum gorgonifer]|uniref:Uncharacterized protein n=1 Tax=Cephalotrichum gorgonifer TaxID=2041049 RepID=A0AAE8SUT5_9PEZI|nr:uncharacterized protein DNG_04699 [Cephalotrichum gorgonifer]
MTKKFDRI